MKTFFKSALVLLIPVMLLTSCADLLNMLLEEEDPITAEQRIQLFEEELNKEDRSEAYLHFSTTATEDYNNIKDASILNNDFPYDNTDPYVITVTDKGNNLWAGTVKGGNYWAGEPIEFDMVTDSAGDAFIDNLRVYSSDTDTEPTIEIKQPLL